MSSGPYLINYTSSAYNQFEALGHPGKYYNVQTVQNGTADFTGSNFGYGAVMVGESSAAGTITLSAGGTINIAHLTVGTLYQLSPIKIVESGNKAVYVFKRQQ
jgi:hypothetical protein